MAVNAVERAIQALGGPTPASYVCRVSVNAIWHWRKMGRVRHAEGLVRLWRAAVAAGLDVTIDELAGLPCGNGENADVGEARRRIRGSSKDRPRRRDRRVVTGAGPLLREPKPD